MYDIKLLDKITYLSLLRRRETLPFFYFSINVFSFFTKIYQGANYNLMRISTSIFPNHHIKMFLLSTTMNLNRTVDLCQR
jgi:hypothetical protein